MFDMDGVKIEKGDSVGFKSDIETYGEVVQVGPGHNILVSVYDSTTGDSKVVSVSPDRCWHN